MESSVTRCNTRGIFVVMELVVVWELVVWNGNMAKVYVSYIKYQITDQINGMVIW